MDNKTQVKKIIKTFLSMLSAWFVLSGASVCRSAILLSTSYSQDFNGLTSTESTAGNTWTDNSTIEGWYANQLTYNVNHGNSTTAAMYDFGALNSSDRALGSVNSGSKTPIVFGVAFQNNRGETITAVTISYRGEQWRGSENTPDSLTFQYLAGDPPGNLISSGSWTTVSQLGFSGPIANNNTFLDGNAAPNSATVSFTISGLSIANGSDIWLRWVDSDVTGSDAGLAIDDFTITAVPEPAEWGLISAFGMLGICGLREWRQLRQRRAANLSSGL